MLGRESMNDTDNPADIEACVDRHQGVGLLLSDPKRKPIWHGWSNMLEGRAMLSVRSALGAVIRHPVGFEPSNSIRTD